MIAHAILMSRDLELTSVLKSPEGLWKEDQAVLGAAGETPGTTASFRFSQRLSLRQVCFIHKVKRLPEHALTEQGYPLGTATKCDRRRP